MTLADPNSDPYGNFPGLDRAINCRRERFPWPPQSVRDGEISGTARQIGPELFGRARLHLPPLRHPAAHTAQTGVVLIFVLSFPSVNTLVCIQRRKRQKAIYSYTHSIFLYRLIQFPIQRNGYSAPPIKSARRKLSFVRSPPNSALRCPTPGGSCARRPRAVL